MRKPLLQLVHISDLHFRKGVGDKAALALQGRLLDRKARELVEKFDLGGWNEGTLGHDQTAASAFRTFLVELRRSSPRWFGDPAASAAPQTWLVDTGDATTFGDMPSMAEARKRLIEWESALKPCRMRTLYGNHDAWPDTQPAFRQADYDATMHVQHQRIREWDAWQRERWQPALRVELPDRSAAIELHALDTVSFGFVDNVLAVGRVRCADVDALCGRLQAAPAGSLHILATHHPLVFPYEGGERSVAGKEKMVLSGAAALVERLRNEQGAPNGQGRTPLVHLFLSGHTHLSHPGHVLPPNLQTLYQGLLSTRQAQFVAGSLLLPRDFDKVRANAQPQVTTKDHAGFAVPKVYDATQQFQVLRFYRDDDLDDGLLIERFVMARSPNGGSYRAVPELSSDEPSFIAL